MTRKKPYPLCWIKWVFLPAGCQSSQSRKHMPSINIRSCSNTKKKRDVFFVFDNLIRYSEMNEKLAFMTKQYDFFLLFFWWTEIERMTLIILKRNNYFFIIEMDIDRYWCWIRNELHINRYFKFIFLLCQFSDRAHYFINKCTINYVNNIQYWVVLVDSCKAKLPKQTWKSQRSMRWVVEIIFISFFLLCSSFEPHGSHRTSSNRKRYHIGHIFSTPSAHFDYAGRKNIF